MDQLPIYLNLRGRTVLLVGEGAAADAKARLLAAAGARILRGVGLPAAPAPADLRIAIVAVDDDEQAEALAAELKAAGLLVNVVDRPSLCDFTLPAIIDRSPVIVAVGTGGASASLAKALRERLEAMLPSSLGPLAAALFQARDRLKQALPSPAARRKWLYDILSPGGALDPLADDAEPGERLAEALEAGGREESPSAFARLSLAGADPDDLTLRQLRCLAQADTIFHAAGVPKAVLDRARRDAVRILSEERPDRLPPGRSVFIELGNGRSASEPFGAANGA